MPHRFAARNMARLDSPERRRLLPPDETLRGIGLRPGQTLLDVGAGVGFFALPAVTIVGAGGRVIAVDVSAEMAAELRRRGAGTALEVRVCGDYDLGVASRSVDLALLAFVLHENGDPLRLLRAVAAALAPGGRVAVLEWIKKPTAQGPPLDERLEAAEVEGLLAAAGLPLTDCAELNPLHYRVLARRV